MVILGVRAVGKDAWGIYNKGMLKSIIEQYKSLIEKSLKVGKIAKD